ncbi:hypothetical protein ACSQ67_011566 [Phaseolus vulgaris]
MQGSESFLRFQQSWLFSKESNLHEGCDQWNHVSPKSTTHMRSVQNFSLLEIATCYSSMFKGAKEKQQHGESSSSGWLYSNQMPIVIARMSQQTQDLVLRKRSFMGETMQATNAKKPCTTTSKATKPKSSPPKDPQNVAAKVHRPLKTRNTMGAYLI